MSNRHQSESSSGVKFGAYIIFIAIIAVKVFRSVLNTIVKTYNGIVESRRYNRV